MRFVNFLLFLKIGPVSYLSRHSLIYRITETRHIKKARTKKHSAFIRERLSSSQIPQSATQTVSSPLLSLFFGSLKRKTDRVCFGNRRSGIYNFGDVSRGAGIL